MESLVINYSSGSDGREGSLHCQLRVEEMEKDEGRSNKNSGRRTKEGKEKVGEQCGRREFKEDKEV